MYTPSLALKLRHSTKVESGIMDDQHVKIEDEAAAFRVASSTYLCHTAQKHI